MNDIHQLIKQEGTQYGNVFPKAYVQGITDKNSGKTLDEILSNFNMYFLSYDGDIKNTRLQVPLNIRKKGLWVTYINLKGNVVTEWYNNNSVEDKDWENSDNWIDGSNMLSGDLAISSEGYWVINGVNTKLPARGKEGITPLLRGFNGKLQVSYNNGESFNYLDLPTFVKEDNEDIKAIIDSNGIKELKFADKAYNPAEFSGLGRVILRKNIVQGKNVLTQEMINKPNTVYEIRYDFDLNDAELNIPENCTLDFKGGTIFNGKLKGIINNEYARPEWFKDKKQNDWHDAFQLAIDICPTIRLKYFIYDIYKPITIYVYTSVYGIGMSKTQIVSHVENDFLIYQNYSHDGSTPLSTPYSFCTIENLTFCYKRSEWIDDQDIVYNKGSKCIIKESYLKLDKVEFRHFELNIYAPKYSDNLFMINCINDPRSFLKKPGFDKFKDANIIYLNNGDNTFISNCQWFSCYFKTCSNILLSNNIQIGVVLDYSQCCIISPHIENSDMFGISLNNSKLTIKSGFMHIPKDYSDLIHVYPYGPSYINIDTFYITYKNGSSYKFKQPNIIKAEPDAILYCKGNNVFVDTNNVFHPACININNKIINVGDSDFEIYNNELIQTQVYKGGATISDVKLTDTDAIKFENISLNLGLYKYKVYDVIDEKRKLYRKEETELIVNYDNTTKIIQVSFYNYRTCNTKYMLIRTNPDNTKSQVIVHPTKALNPVYYDNGIGLYGNNKWEKYVELNNINQCESYVYETKTDNCIIHSKSIPKYGEWTFGDVVIIDKNKYIYNGEKWVDTLGNPADAFKKGTTSQRPTGVQIGFTYKDTDLNKWIIWNGEAWENIDGTALV